MNREEYEKRYALIAEKMKESAGKTSHYVYLDAENKKGFYESIDIRSSSESCAMPHTHGFLALAYVASGSAEHFCADTVTHIKKGDYFIVDYGVRHAYVSDKSD